MEAEPRQIFYNRSGNLATTTHLNESVAQQFMKEADMRRDIIIEDSDKMPEGAATRVGTDVLAWRVIPPIGELLATRFKPQQLHTLTREDTPLNRTWRVAIHEQVVDDLVRKEGYVDRSDYEEKFLGLLNKAVKSGVYQALTSEKLGWNDQNINYLRELAYLVMLPVINPLLWLGGLFILHPALNFYSISDYKRSLQILSHFRDPPLPHPLLGNRSWKEILLPTVPIEKWVLGSLFLSRHGNELISPKPSI